MTCERTLSMALHDPPPARARLPERAMRDAVLDAAARTRADGLDRAGCSTPGAGALSSTPGPATSGPASASWPTSPPNEARPSRTSPDLAPAAPARRARILMTHGEF